MTLHIHVLGPGYGECIVLHFFPGEPDECIGVIDDCADKRGVSLIPDYLRRHFNTTKIAFLAITHPHADHCLGVQDVLNKVKVEELWLFDAVVDRNLFLHYKHQIALNQPDLVAAALRLDLGLLPQAVTSLLEEVRERGDKGTFIYLRAGMSLDRFNNRVTIDCLTPVDATIHLCRENLLRATEAAEARLRGDGVPLPNPWDPNLASTAFLIRYGQTRVLLLADALESMWKAWLKSSYCKLFPKMPIHFVKAGHHGSKTGCYEPLFESPFQITADTVVVVTPFSAGSVRLPKSEGVSQLRKLTTRVYCTQGRIARENSPADWHVDDQWPTEFPASWLKDIETMPRLRELLVPPWCSERVAPADVALPLRWAADLRDHPGLRRFLRPIGSPGQPYYSVDDYHVSFQFDDRGNGSQLHVGAGVGRLSALALAAEAPGGQEGDEDCA